MRNSRTNAASNARPFRGRACHSVPRSEIRNPKSDGGFTLIETSLAIIIVSTGVLAIVAAEQAYHQQNNASLKIGTALMLANEVREMTLSLPSCDPILGKEYFGPEPGEAAVSQYNDLDDFAGPTGGGISISPPIDANRNVIPNMERWTQVVTAECVLENLINGAAVPPGSTDVVRLTCRVLYQGPYDAQPVEITRLTWVKAGR